MSTKTNTGIEAIDLKTNRFEPTEILFDSYGFVIASGIWTEPGHGEIANALALRWHQKEGVGYPNGRGRAQWMRFGNLTTNDVTKHKLDRFAKRISIDFNPDQSDVEVGNWVYVAGEWMIVDYVYGLSGNMVSVIGMDKSAPFPIDTSQIDKVATGKNILGMWHARNAGDNILVWISPEGALVTTRLDTNIKQNGNIILKSTYLDRGFSTDEDYEVIHDHIGFPSQLDGYVLIGKLFGGTIFNSLKKMLRSLSQIIIDDEEMREKITVKSGIPAKNMRSDLDTLNEPNASFDICSRSTYYDMSDVFTDNNALLMVTRTIPTPLK